MEYVWGVCVKEGGGVGGRVDGCELGCWVCVMCGL